jgi:endonuclease/exonuclease/phosphatase family metal-dependent hydrolase
MIVVAWNMGRRHHKAAWTHLLDGLTPDLALLQETAPPPEAFQRGQILHARAYPRESWGSAVYVKQGAARELPLPPEHRGWLMAADVELPGFVSLVAVSVHARLLHRNVRPNLDRAFDALELLVAGRSFVLGGDLNLSRTYDTVYRTTHHGQFLDGLEARGYVDCLRRFHAEEPQTFWGPGTSHAYQNDYVFVSQDLATRVAACEVVDRVGLSDHSPLRLILEQAPQAVS